MEITFNVPESQADLMLNLLHSFNFVSSISCRKTDYHRSQASATAPENLDSLLSGNKLQLFTSPITSTTFPEASQKNRGDLLRLIMHVATMTVDNSMQLKASYFSALPFTLDNEEIKLKGNGKFKVRHHNWCNRSAFSYTHREANTWELFYEEQNEPGVCRFSIATIRRAPHASTGYLSGRALGPYPIEYRLFDSMQTGELTLGETLQLEDIKAPEFHPPAFTPAQKKYSIKDFRAKMDKLGVGVSQPFVCTLTREDYQIAGYSFSGGELDAYNNPLRGGAAGLAGKAVVFTAFGYSDSELTFVLDNLFSSAEDKYNYVFIDSIFSKIIYEYAVEIAVVMPKALSLGDYVSAALGEKGGKVDSLEKLIQMRRTCYAAGSDDNSGLVTRIVTAGVDQVGEPVGPLREINLATKHALFTINQARFRTQDYPVTEWQPKYSGLVPKIANLLRHGTHLVSVKVNYSGGYKVEAVPWVCSLLENAQLIAHFEVIVERFFNYDARQSFAPEYDEQGEPVNQFWDALYILDLFLYLSFVDNRSNFYLTESWNRSGSPVLLNVEYMLRDDRIPFKQVQSPGTWRWNEEGSILDIEDMLEVMAFSKAYPTFNLNLTQLVAGTAD